MDNIDDLIQEYITKIIYDALIESSKQVLPDIENEYKNMFLQIVVQFYAQYPQPIYQRKGYYNLAKTFDFNFDISNGELHTPQNISDCINGELMDPHYSVTGQDNFDEDGIALFALSVGKHSNFPWIVARGGERRPWEATLSLSGIGSAKGNPAKVWSKMSKLIDSHYEDVVVNTAIQIINK